MDSSGLGYPPLVSAQYFDLNRTYPLKAYWNRFLLFTEVRIVNPVYKNRLTTRLESSLLQEGMIGLITEISTEDIAPEPLALRPRTTVTW